MLFNSLHYLIFLPLVVMLYFSIPDKYRWIFLLIASYYFYMCWKVEYILLLIIFTCVNYYCGLQMGRREDIENRKTFLLISIISNLGILFLFKYFNFFSDSINDLFRSINIFYNNPAFNMLLPVGISFYTFQTLGYSIDVYLGKQQPEKHLGIFALYVSFFPQLIAGPIERAGNLLPKLHKPCIFVPERTSDGLKLILWGYFKKVVIADRLAVIVNNIYNDPLNFDGIHYIIATIFFSFQIYCDFSGYSDIAIGSAKILGYDLMQNFKHPYFAVSIQEFWKRWHISLTSWFRDFLYMPMSVAPWFRRYSLIPAGKTCFKIPRWYFAVIITFMLSGLWHGANWTFIIWGGLNGLLIIISIAVGTLRKRIASYAPWINSGIYSVIRIILTFILINISWIFFRANNLNDAWYILTNLFKDFGNVLAYLSNPYHIRSIFSAFGVSTAEFITGCVAISILVIVEMLQDKYNLIIKLKKQRIFVRWLAYYFLLLSILFYGAFNSSQQFIYFQF